MQAVHQSFNSSFSSGLASAQKFQLELCFYRYCGADVREQSLYSPNDYAYPRYSSPTLREDFAENSVSLAQFIEIEETFDRSFERGWFSIDDARRLQSGPTPGRILWQMRSSRGYNSYPWINTFDVSGDVVQEYEEQVKIWMNKKLNSTLSSDGDLTV